jgi:flagella basal body P-ring formation protein FlgA
VAGAGEALTAGLEGMPARVRTESGRVISGMPVAERQLELAL